MSDSNEPAARSRPRWDGSRILFEIEQDGQTVSCAISRGAVQDLSERRCFKTAELLQCFDDKRGRIEAIARSKFRAAGENVSGVVSVWADDIDDVPPPPAA